MDTHSLAYEEPPFLRVNSVKSIGPGKVLWFVIVCRPAAVVGLTRRHDYLITHTHLSYLCSTISIESGLNTVTSEITLASGQRGPSADSTINCGPRLRLFVLVDTPCQAKTRLGCVRAPLSTAA